MKMQYFDWNLSGYNLNQVRLLRKELKRLGVEENQPHYSGWDGGGLGGPVLLWISLHYQDIAVGLASGAVYDALKMIASGLYRWRKKNKHTKDIRPAVVIWINYYKESKGHSAKIYIDQEYSVDDLKKLLSQPNVDEFRLSSLSKYPESKEG